jgi:glyoxylase-like metal-dependent hydrolase (beta-lactamase superfamily II)
MPDVGQAQSTAVPTFMLKQVGPNVWAAIDNPAAKGVAAANGGFVIGDDGVAVIDSFASANAAKELLTEIRQRTKLPIRFVINTHYHLDHVGGNGVLADAGASVLAHRNVRTWIQAENLRLVGDKAPPGMKTMIQGFTRPSVLHIDGVNL